MLYNNTSNHIEDTLKLAKTIQKASSAAKDNLFVERIGPIVNEPKSKIFLIRMMDVAFRSSNYLRVSKYVNRLLSTPANYKGLFKWYEKIMVKLYKLVGYKLPKISIPLMLAQIQNTTESMVFYIGDKKFNAHCDDRRTEGIKLNVNLIGETLVGEREADQRIQAYVALLNEKKVNYISIKISTIYSHISPLAHKYTVDQLVEKLSILYDEVLKITEETGETKFINLDMEEYQDMSLTVDTFINTLSQSRFKYLRAGIVLQAYLPDSHEYMIRLQKWALERVADGGSPIKIRIVKGANIEMEKTESSMEDWPVVTFGSKMETDANFKKMLSYLLNETSCKAVNLGIGSHNVFDLSYAIAIIQKHNLSQYVDIEMLEGMANAVVDEILIHKLNILLYMPVVHHENYTNAIAYLVRRLDEGTADGNFLKESIGLKIDSQKWESLKDDFLKSMEMISEVSSLPNRTQNRASKNYIKQGVDFKNVANTDWILKANQDWISEVKKRWTQPKKIFGGMIPVVNGVEPKIRRTITQVGWSGVQPWLYELANIPDYQNALEADSSWYRMSNSERIQVLRQVAVEIEKNRGDLIGVAVTELGKLIGEVDVEISEAVDFANYYAYSLTQLMEDGIECKSGGINLVLSPWNFPVAIPCGGVLASLIAGKRVILKPSQNAAATAYLMCKCLWDGGIPKDALLFMPTIESNLDGFLSYGNKFDAVILTGGTDTAKFLLNRNPRLNLFAETGGKNATIITSLSDREQGIKHVVQSAFGNTGQKCSATSLLILEKEVFDDEKFKQLFKDAVESRIVGNPWSYESQIGPLAVEISSKLKQSIAMTPKDQWLVEPVLKESFVLSPGVKWGVTKEDFEYKNELFGPILSVMKANDLEAAIALVNDTGYGLTSGLESLDEEEIEYWLAKVKAGNLYVNRSTTGAIVQRQPFGGMKASNFGFGMKAGGPNYILQFLDVISKSPEENYQSICENHFARSIDYAKIRGQHNHNIFLKPSKIMLLIGEKSTREDIQLIKEIGRVTNVKIDTFALKKTNQCSDYKIIDSFLYLEDQINHDVIVRALNYDDLDDDFLRLCHQKAVHVYGSKPNKNGRIELLSYLNEQNRSINYHRYGNLMGEE